MSDRRDIDIPLAARAYLAAGWSVIPMEARGKRPVVAWLPYQERRASVEELESWYAKRPDANVGIVAGVVSDLVVLDIDATHGGPESLADLEREHGPLPATVECRTGGGGRHLYFRHPGGKVGNRVGMLAGIDVRGDGGCVVAPPSIHPNGQRYRWVRGCSPAEREPARLPDWLRRRLQPGGSQPGHSLAHWRELVRTGVEQGARNSTLASLAGHLLWHEVDPEVTLELLLAWNRLRCRPPLADSEVAAVVASISRRHEGDEGDKR